VERALAEAGMGASDIAVRADGFATLLGDTLGMAASVSMAYASSIEPGPTLVVDTTRDATSFAAVVMRGTG
jgi:hypothetical protein